MERGDDRAAVGVEPLASNPADRDLAVQHDARGEVPQGDHDSGADGVERSFQEGTACLDLVGQWIAVARRTAPDHVRDVHVLAPKADLTEEPGEELARRADERLTLLVLVVA